MNMKTFNFFNLFILFPVFHSESLSLIEIGRTVRIDGDEKNKSL